MALSKRDAEDVAAWLCDSGIKAQYLHSELNTVERAEVLQALQGSGYHLVGLGRWYHPADGSEGNWELLYRMNETGMLRTAATHRPIRCSPRSYLDFSRQ